MRKECRSHLNAIKCPASVSDETGFLAVASSGTKEEALRPETESHPIPLSFTTKYECKIPRSRTEIAQKEEEKAAVRWCPVKDKSDTLGGLATLSDTSNYIHIVGRGCDLFSEVILVA